MPRGIPKKKNVMPDNAENDAIKPIDESIQEAENGAGEAVPSETLNHTSSVSETLDEATRAVMEVEGDIPDAVVKPVNDLNGMTPEQIDAVAKRMIELQNFAKGNEYVEGNDTHHPREGKDITVRVYETRDEFGEIMLEKRRYVVETGKAFPQVVKDLELDREVSKLFIYTKLNDGSKLKMEYNELMKLPRVKCALVERKTETSEVVTGEVYAKHLNRFVSQKQMFVKTTYTLKTPDGVTLVIKQPNA